MRFWKPLVSAFMALLIGVTSLGMAVSAHTCSEAGVAETSIGHLKACCMQAKGQGIRSEPCCKVQVQHIKLATVRHYAASQDGHTLDLSPALPALPAPSALYPSLTALRAHRAHPPERPPRPLAQDAQAQLCRFLI